MTIDSLRDLRPILNKRIKEVSYSIKKEEKSQQLKENNFRIKRMNVIKTAIAIFLIATAGFFLFNFTRKASEKESAENNFKATKHYSK